MNCVKGVNQNATLSGPDIALQLMTLYRYASWQETERGRELLPPSLNTNLKGYDFAWE
jgi:hypothetical protein